VAVTVSLRRGRFYFVGKFDDFTVNVTLDFGGSPDGSPTLYEANINYTGIKPVEPVGRLAPLDGLRKSYQRPKRIFRLWVLITCLF
jgi:phosphate-selective porin OprO/OprP